MYKIDLPSDILGNYNKFNLLIDNLNFSYEKSVIHTKEHCRHVLLFALLIVEKLNLSEKFKEILGLCASFHDSRRLDDSYDVGHGKRAAKFYKSYCAKKNLNFESYVYDIISFHDQDDEFFINKFSKDTNLVLLYKIFKDADALDRFRLGENALDTKYLRTKEAISLYDFAKTISLIKLG